MVLEARNASVHNVFLGRSTHQAESPTYQMPERLTKRRKLSNGDDENKSSKFRKEDLHNSSKRENKAAAVQQEIPDSDAGSDNEGIGVDDTNIPSSQLTDLEQALPPVKTDKEAIEEYEVWRAGEEASELRKRLGEKGWVTGKSSIYVDAFNLALETVLEDESHLFNAAEMKVFEEWMHLDYEARYLYVRLFLRKTAAWHRIDKLGYYGDIGDMHAAIKELYKSRALPCASHGEQVTPGELEPPEGATLEGSFTFADSSNDHINTVEEASSLLMLDELKAIAKEAKVQGKNKSELLDALRRTSGKQTALGFASLKRSDTEQSNQSECPPDEERRSLDSEPSDIPQNRDQYYLEKVLKETGECIRLTSAAFHLFERVHLVFYRSTEWNEKSLTTIILAQIARRNFPDYIVSRSANIFPSRALLLEFEASIRTQFRVDNILEFNGTPTKESLQIILDIFEEVYPRWKALLEEEQKKEDSIYSTGEGAYLRRLSPAWVYTRIVHKGAYVLGIGKFKQHFREHAILTELLEQRLFHASRRGSWYQRKALLEEHYMASLMPSEGRSEVDQKKHWKRIALRTCEEGLQDHLVHLIYHYDLQKRLVKLEKQLKVPKRLQHDFGHATLAKPKERTFHGIRVEKSSYGGSVGRPRMQSSNSNDAQKQQTLRRSSSAPTPFSSITSRRGAKTTWLDPADPSDQTECGVEAMCLSQYRSLGYKGYHTEGGLLRTLFALLFYDILFFEPYIPNVFQTAYQTCPLDLHTDAFYPSRLSEVNVRLAQISNGEAEDILMKFWEAEHERKTCVVGLDWGFELDDLRSIVRVFQDGGKLAGVMRVLCEEYAQRGGGVPDLFLWKERESEEDPGENEVVFAEVKSENDRLSDTQRLWIHVLAGLGIKVELCNAVASEVRMA